jgi:hypothetical protein
MRIMVHDLVLPTERYGEVVVHLLIVEEILPNHGTAVAQAQHELVKAVVRVDFHDVPQNGPAADLDHGLGSKVGFFAESRAHPSAQNDRFHRCLPEQ